MKLGTLIIDLETRRKGHVMSINPTNKGVFAWIGGRKVYVRKWCLASSGAWFKG